MTQAGRGLNIALATMDVDQSGMVEFGEFEAWWRSNGGDLQAQRDLAFTIFAGNVQLLLVGE